MNAQTLITYFLPPEEVDPSLREVVNALLEAGQEEQVRTWIAQSVLSQWQAYPHTLSQLLSDNGTAELSSAEILPFRRSEPAQTEGGDVEPEREVDQAEVGETAADGPAQKVRNPSSFVESLRTTVAGVLSIFLPAKQARKSAKGSKVRIAKQIVVTKTGAEPLASIDAISEPRAEAFNPEGPLTQLKAESAQAAGPQEHPFSEAENRETDEAFIEQRDYLLALESQQDNEEPDLGVGRENEDDGGQALAESQPVADVGFQPHTERLSVELLTQETAPFDDRDEDDLLAELDALVGGTSTEEEVAPAFEHYDGSGGQGADLDLHHAIDAPDVDLPKNDLEPDSTPLNDHYESLLADADSMQGSLEPVEPEPKIELEPQPPKPQPQVSAAEVIEDHLDAEPDTANWSANADAKDGNATESKPSLSPTVLKALATLNNQYRQ